MSFDRLNESKGYATSESVSGSLVYRAAVSREDLLDRRLKEAAAELCDGAAAPLVLALVQGNRFTKDELERIRKTHVSVSIGENFPESAAISISR